MAESHIQDWRGKKQSSIPASSPSDVQEEEKHSMLLETSVGKPKKKKRKEKKKTTKTHAKERKKSQGEEINTTKTEQPKWDGGFTQEEQMALAFKRKKLHEKQESELPRSDFVTQAIEKNKEKKRTIDEFGRERTAGYHSESSSESEQSTTSTSRRGRSPSNIPPADPRRPDLDETRHFADKRRTISKISGGHSSRRRSRSRSRSRKSSYKRRDRSRSRSEGKRRDSYMAHSRRNRRSRSRSRSRDRSRSAECGRRSKMVSTWTHDGFFNRSPSPPREVDPFYKPEPPSWQSKAGGVYIPKKLP